MANPQEDILVPRAEVTAIQASRRWLEAWPGACVGALHLAGVRNPESDDEFDRLLDETAARLRDRWAGHQRADLLALPEMAAYAAYYRRFDKTYHVLLQLESVAFKGKPLRARGALVAAMFRAELEDRLLTAGHDADLLEWPLEIGVVAAGDGFTGIGGREVTAAKGDMCIRDRAGIVASVVDGPDHRTRLRPETTSVVFTTYAPASIGPEAVRRHLESITANVRVFAPASTVEGLTVVEAKERR